MNHLLKKIFDLFLFTSLFVSCCAVIMVYQSYTLMIGKPMDPVFAAFVFSSTVCSYNFHWALTPHMLSPSHRLAWGRLHYSYHYLLAMAGLLGSAICFFLLIEHWIYMVIAGIFSFLYTAPKISFPPFQWLKKIAIGKTIFLALAWTYVTAVLPVLVEEHNITTKEILFGTCQFFLIYAICILFDFRDREDDKADGIRSMITWFNEKSIDILFCFSLLVFLMFTLLLRTQQLEWENIILLLIPGILLFTLYRYAKRNFSDYLYYFVLDGLMMFSGLLLWLVNMF